MEADPRREYEGPRRPTEDERAAVTALNRDIFYRPAASPAAKLRAWPMQPDPAGTLAMFKDGQPVSVVDRLERDMLVHGHRLRMGYIGGVCTHPDHRGKGLASTILAAQLRQLREDSVDLVYISGGRDLYVRAGAGHAAVETRFVVERDALPVEMPVRLVRAGAGEVDALVAISQSEGVRLIRPRIDWETVIEKEHCGGKPCAFHLVKWNGIAVAYLLVSHNTGDRMAHVLEFAGDRTGILSALGLLRQKLDRETRLGISVPHGDLLLDRFERLGLPGRLVGTEGTMMVVDVGRVMHKLMPLFRERLRAWHAGNLHVTAGQGRYMVCAEDGCLHMEGPLDVLWTLLGRPPDAPDGKARATGRMEELVERCLPLPVPSVHVNVI